MEDDKIPPTPSNTETSDAKPTPRDTNPKTGAAWDAPESAITPVFPKRYAMPPAIIAATERQFVDCSTKPDTRPSIWAWDELKEATSLSEVWLK